MKQFMKQLKILHLTLNKEAFEVMVTGEKQEEFRKHSVWIESRLYNRNTWKEKEYDVIRFANGYGKDKPYFICEYLGFDVPYMNVTPRKYSNGLEVDNIGKGDFVILCGKITEKGNIK